MEVDLRLLLIAINMFRWQRFKAGELHVYLHAA